MIRCAASMRDREAVLPQSSQREHADRSVVRHIQERQENVLRDGTRTHHVHRHRIHGMTMLLTFIHLSFLSFFYAICMPFSTSMWVLCYACIYNTVLSTVHIEYNQEWWNEQIFLPFNSARRLPLPFLQYHIFSIFMICDVRCKGQWCNAIGWFFIFHSPRPNTQLPYPTHVTLHHIT